MKLRILTFVIFIFLIGCGKKENIENSFSNGVKAFEDKDYKSAEKYFLQTDKTKNKKSIVYLLRIYEKNDDKENIEKLFKAVTENKEIVFEVAYEYLFGSDTIRVNYLKSKDLFELGIKNKDLLSYLGLGYIYENGLGVDVNLKKAKIYYEKSGLNSIVKDSLGRNFLSYILGAKYEYGIDSPKDIDKAKEFYKKAIEDGNREAKRKIGIIQITENKTERSLRKGLELVEKAVNDGDNLALIELGKVYLYGITFPKDQVKAAMYFQKAADLEVKEAYGYLSYMYIFNDDSTLIDYTKAKEIIDLGLKVKDGTSYRNLGYLYHQGLGMKKNERLAEKYYLKAIAQGNLMDNLVYWNLADLYFYGGKRVQNNAKALENYLISAKYYEASAYEVGLIYENGLGVDIDLEKAKEYYKIAMSLNPKAEDRYNELNKGAVKTEE